MFFQLVIVSAHRVDIATNSVLRLLLDICTGDYNCISLFIGIWHVGLPCAAFSWFRSNRNRVVLFYALASATLTINVIFTLLFVTFSLEGRPQEVRPYTILSVQSSEDPLTFFLGNATIASFILSLILMWGATVSMMAHYAKRIGRTKYSIVVSTPLIYFSSQFLLPLIYVYPTLLEFSTCASNYIHLILFFVKQVGEVSSWTCLLGIILGKSKTKRRCKKLYVHLCLSFRV